MKQAGMSRLSPAELSGEVLEVIGPKAKTVSFIIQDFATLKNCEILTTIYQLGH